MDNEKAIVPMEQAGFIAPVISVDDALRAYQAKKDLIDHIFTGPNKQNPNGVDYGPVPGTDKPTLKKAGAEKATSFFGLSPRFRDDMVVEDWTGEAHGGEPFLHYRQTCDLYKGDRLVASAGGSCNSWEKKYRYRSGERVCPKCGKPAIIKGKEEFGGGWLCFGKKGGCGAKFADAAPEITGQQVGQIKNPDVAEVANTILKMAQKRALVAATLIATGLSEYFTQDMEDFIAPGEFVEGTVKDAPAVNPLKSADPAPAPHGDAHVERPLAPDTLRSLMAKKIAKYGTTAQMTEIQRKVLASALSNTLTADVDRYAVCRWLVGEASTKKMSDAQARALLDWQEVAGFEDMPPQYVIEETHAVLVAANAAAGQEKLIP